MSMGLPTASLGKSEQPFGGPVPAGDGAVERFGDDGVVGGFHDRAEQAFALGVVAALGSGLPAQFFEQAGQLGLQGDVVDQQHRQDETCRAESVDPAGIKAEIESGRVENRRQRDVEQPGAHHDHEPDVEHGMRSPKPQDQQRREAETPHRRHDADHGGRKVPLAQQRRQNVMSGGDDPGRDRYRNADRNDAAQDRPASRSPYFGPPSLSFSSA